MTNDIADKIMLTIVEHPGLPVKILAPSTPSDYDTYYHDATGVSVKRLLFPHEVERLYGDTFGLDMDRTYDDANEVAEQILSYMLWDDEHGKELMHEGKDMYETAAMGIKWVRIYQPIADMMAEDMPWHECIVIDCY